MNKKLKIILPLLFALAILLGIFRYAQTTIFKNQSAQTLPDKSLEDFYNQAKDLMPQTEPNSTTSTTFLAVGDISLSRNVASAINASKDPQYPFAGMADILHSVDFNFGNLESPFSQKPTIGGHSLIFGAPTSGVLSLLSNKFLVVNLANNHAFDGGLTDLDFTISQLDSSGVKHMGTGDNITQAWQPAVLTSNGIKICFVGASYASANDGGKSKNGFVARMEDLDNLKTAITTAKSECDFVVATMHGGIEYTRTPIALQTNFAHAAIDDGADVVIGAHPHWVQTIEKYQNKYIFYSLGNFIFDQAWSKETQEGLALKITISKNTTTNAAAPGAATLDDLQGGRKSATLDSIELLPVIINNSRPRPATADETKNILLKINQTETILK
jgi:poly-gamma-glutamate capsule biosynthesis protein CapA/YwtB (metallophosphatase superfamily)